MTRSVLFLGNSHIAALRVAWKRNRDLFKDWSVEFFAANANLFNALELDRRKVFGAHGTRKRQVARFLQKIGLIQENEAEKIYSSQQLKSLDLVCGRRTVDLMRFDHVVLVGRNANEADCLLQMEPFSIDGLREDPERAPLSRSAFDTFATEIARKRLPDAAWLGWDHPRLSLLPAPRPLSGCPESETRYAPWARFEADPLSGPALLEAYRDRVAALYAENGLTLLTPPKTVLADTGLTRPEFGDPSLRLHPKSGDLGDSDYHHMSPAYGKLVLEHVLAGFDAGPEA